MLSCKWKALVVVLNMASNTTKTTVLCEMQHLCCQNLFFRKRQLLNMFFCVKIVRHCIIVFIIGHTYCAKPPKLQ